MHICITGASRGLGASLCREFVEKGHRVWGVARDAEQLQSIQKELGTDAFHFSIVDVSSISDVQRWASDMEKEGFIPDIAILNASIREKDLDQEYHFKKSEAMFKVNLQGVLYCVECLLPSMYLRNRGTFILIGSTSSLRSDISSMAYCSAKAAAVMAFRCFRRFYKSHTIRFATVTLGPIATNMWEGRKNTMLIGDPTIAAKHIATFALSGGANLFYPFFSTFLFRISLWLPDDIFARLSTKLLK